MDMLDISASLPCILSHQALRTAVVTANILHVIMPVKLLANVECS